MDTKHFTVFKINQEDHKTLKQTAADRYPNVLPVYRVEVLANGTFCVVNVFIRSSKTTHEIVLTHNVGI